MVGRAPENDIVIENPTVSRTHLQIVQTDDGKYSLTHLSNVNPTHVNGEEITHRRPVALQETDIIKVGTAPPLRWMEHFNPTQYFVPQAEQVYYQESTPHSATEPVFAHKPASKSQLAETQVFEPEYAGFWLRFVAIIIDGFTLGLLTGVLAFISFISNDIMISAIIAIISALFGWLYFAILESSSKQGTLGKMALGLKVTDLDGNPISFGRASGRHFSKIITAIIPFAIGFMLAGWTAKKQAIHDMIAGCLVVKK